MEQIPQQPSNPSTPPMSRSSSTASAKRRRSPPLSIDLSNVPPLVKPAPASNTLLITNLTDPAIFAPATLDTIRELITQHSPSGIHTFSPIRGMQRIIVTFPDVSSATAVRAIIGDYIAGHRMRVFFGEPTPLDGDKEKHLKAPKLDKQFFISPPPSPPHGWESREEEPPNKEVHAADLATALKSLNGGKEHHDFTAAAPGDSSTPEVRAVGGRSRSSTVVVFDPEEHGKSPNLPAINVEDTTDSPEALSPIEGGEGDAEDLEHGQWCGRAAKATMPLAHTSRPPVELMSSSS